MMIYMIVFSETAAQLIGGFFNQSLGDVWYSSKLVYVIGLGVCLGPVVVKRNLQNWNGFRYCWESQL